MKGWMNMNAWMNKQTSTYINKQLQDEWMNEYMNEHMNEWMNEWMDGWMNACMNDKWMDEWTNECECLSKRKASTYHTAYMYMYKY